MKADLSALDHRYRARRSAQTPAEYSCAIEIHRRPSRNWLAYSMTAAVVAAIVAIRLV